MVDTQCSFYPLDDYQSSDYQWIRYYRIASILITSSCISYTIFDIIKKKQYVYNTIRIFMFLQIFFVLSMLVVLPHNLSLNNNFAATNNISCIGNLVEKMLDEGEVSSMAFNALEGFSNLVFYNVSYLFAVLITLYIRTVLDNTHKNFMKRFIKKILGATLFIMLWYMIPFVFSFINDPTWVKFSFGPTGFRIYSTYYFLYSGIVSRQISNTDAAQITGVILAITWMIVLPLILFVVHLILLLKNRKSQVLIRKIGNLNPRQFFIVRSGKISIIIFFIQLINFIKLALSLILDLDESRNWITLLIINMTYDFLGLVPFGLYTFKLKKEGISLQQSSLLQSSSDSLISRSEIV